MHFACWFDMELPMSNVDKIIIYDEKITIMNIR